MKGTDLVGQGLGAGTLDLVTVTVSGWRFPALGWSALPAFSFSPISVTVPYVFF